MRDLDIASPLFAERTIQAFTGTAAEKDLSALRGRSVIFAPDQDCYIDFYAATGETAVTAARGIFIAAGSKERYMIKKAAPFLQVIRATADGTLQMWATTNNKPKRAA